jgi:predicted transcriptional regulator of viral defense system
MSLQSLRRKVSSEVFDYQLLIYHLNDVKYPRAKIGRLLRNGDIIRIKKGLYAFGEIWRKESICLEAVANLIYGPSCVSFEYALFRYGMIAERAVTITSLTVGRAKEFETPIGTFQYRSIDRNKFSVGIEYREIPHEGGFFIASREKALADVVSRIKPSTSLSDLRFYLREELRMDMELLHSLDKQKLTEIGSFYRNKLVDKLLQL